MNPSQSNTDAGASSKDAESTRLMNSGEKDGPPRDSSFQSSAPSAPLLESMEPEPPSYNSVIAQDSSDSKNRFSSSSTGNLHQADNQAPYPTGPGSVPQTPYPTGTGYSPQAVGNPPYPGGPGLGSPVTSQPPYSTGSGYTPGPASQAPYPTGPMPMPMPGPVETGPQIGFVAPVTIEPKPSYTGSHNVGYWQRTSYFTPAPETQKKVVIVIAIFMATFVAVVLFGIVTIIVSFSRSRETVEQAIPESEEPRRRRRTSQKNNGKAGGVKI